ncbi:HlyIII-domain-containing protein [Anaeromyces robustus]|uniref:HlyIII-domain-containing protein n=1 Tax=Anaeromyces robustus TaxID=1754192 RepID=A0A1Y1WYR5_9FUNG|nr:HlyIII-domain-containing protein [Anaeromyces robustus]|eukprot:ORX78535.1 HlyIII-domain-containing protein [Anaeromyces robustus]
MIDIPVIKLSITNTGKTEVQNESTTEIKDGDSSSLPSEEEEINLKEDNRNLLNASKYYTSTNNLLLRYTSKTKKGSKQNLLRTTLEKNGENAEFYSLTNLKTDEDSGILKHSKSSLLIPSIEKNSREHIGIRKLRKTLTNPHLSDGSLDSLYSEFSGSTDSFCSSVASSTYSICESCESICESVIDLLEKKDIKRFTEMENGHLKLITYNQCPKWLADNPYIITNYRPPCYSYLACAKSLLYIHNETGNIYTHLIGEVLFTIFYIVTAFQYIPSFKILESLEIAVITLSIIGGFTCMYFSSHFHLFSAHSLKVNRNWLTCDFIGIVSLIYTTGLPLSYYSFYCLHDFRVKYMAVSAIIGAVSLIAMFNPIFSRDEYRLIRSGLFLLLAITELIPIGYGLIKFNNDIVFNYLSFTYVATGSILYAIGLFLYAKRLPEKLYPGAFDVWGHSHQIFHSLILIASILFYIGIMKMVKAFNSDPTICTRMI